jgi:hypothetical protein
MKGCKYDFVHLRNFSRHTLKILLEGAGFEVVKFKYDGYLSYRERSWTGGFINDLSRFFSLKNLPLIPNWLGFLLMKPIGIAVICRKQAT